MSKSEGASPSSSLNDVFGSVPSVGEDTPSVPVEKESKPEESDEGDQKFPTSSQQEEESDEKSDESEADDTEEESEEQASDEKPEEKPAESKEKEGKPSQEEKAPKDKWESEDNPYFKRYRDTSANWNREHQARLQLESQVSQMQQDMTVLRKMADGTYDPEKDDPQRQVTHEQVASRAIEVGKAVASRTAAVSQFGAEKVDADLNEFHTVFGNNPLIQQLVLRNEAPVYEAMRILDRYKFESKYGSTPAEWHKTIRAEAEKELTEKLTAEITEKIMGRVDKKKNTPQGLHSSRGSNGMGASQNSKGKGPTPLKNLFG